MLTSVIWLTAASTLFASMPHIECRCPNGQLKLICLTSLIHPGCCCCDNACCEDTNPSTPADGHSCCCKRPVINPERQAPAPSTDPTGAPQARRDGCTKQLVQPGLTVIAYTEVISAAVLEPASIDLQAPTIEAHRANTEAIVSLDILSHHPPAPPDLVVVLQHFLI